MAKFIKKGDEKKKEAPKDKKKGSSSKEMMGKRYGKGK